MTSAYYTEENKLTLDIKRIENYIRNDVNLSPLFLHELLRVSGVNDDSFHKTFELLSILPETEGRGGYLDETTLQEQFELS